MNLTSSTISNNTIVLQSENDNEEGDDYASISLEMPYPINNVKFTFASMDEATAFFDALAKAINVSNDLSERQHRELLLRHSKE